MPVGYRDGSGNGGTGTFGDFLYRPEEAEGRGWDAAMNSDPLTQAILAARSSAAPRGAMQTRRKSMPQPLVRSQAVQGAAQFQSRPPAAETVLKPPVRGNQPPDAKLGFRWTPDPSEPLDLIAKHRDRIHAVAEKYGVSPDSIAAVIYQEKYNGKLMAWGRDLVPDVMGGTLRSRFPGPHHWLNWKHWAEGSIGLAEMQIRTAAKLLNKDLSNPKQADEVVAALRNDDSAIDLIGRYVAQNQKAIGRKLSPVEAGMGHNAGIRGLRAYVRGRIGLGEASVRIKGHEDEIDRALRGDVSWPTVDIGRIVRRTR